MKTCVNTALLVSGLFALSATDALADDKQPDPKKQQKLYEKFATPGTPHKHFKRLAGRWDCEVKWFTPKPTVSQAKANFQVIMGGRFLQQRFRGKLQGKPFQGMGITGYDNAKKKYVGAWIDSMGTGIMTLEGTYDADTQTLTEIGTASSFMGPMKLKLVSKYIDNDKFLFTMSLLKGDETQKMMEITYTRAKKKKADK